MVKSVISIKKTFEIVFFISKLNYKKLVTYRSANISGLIVNLFWLVIQANVLAAFISNGISNYTPEQGIGYVLITEALMMITGLSGCLGGIDIDSMLKSGDVIRYWTNPLGFIGYIVGMEIGRITYYTMWRCLPVFFIGGFMLQWNPHISVYEVILFSISILLAIFLANQIQFMIIMLAMKYQTTNGIMDLFMALILFFSGGLIPLNFFPDLLYKISIILPFSAQIYLPISIFLGTEEKCGQLLVLELMWIVFLCIVNYILYIKERRNLLVQGG